MKSAFRSPDIDESLIKISDVVPQQYRSIFKYDRFNAMQSIIVPQVMQSDINMVIAAPTGSGKTVIHELAILRLLLNADVRDIKCVFIAPNKALCQQRCSEWQKSFGDLGLSVMEVTGDIDMSRSLQLVAKANIIITTPEKWDSLTRSWRRHLFLLGAIDLLLLDEVHHLGEERGPTLETVVVRMRILCGAYSDKIREAGERREGQGDNVKEIARPARSVRIIALSATLPNLADIGDWLRCAPESVHFFDEGFRPVPLTVHTLSYGSAKAPFLFERSLDDKVFEVVKNYSGGKQTLIFCSSKKGTENLSKVLLSKMGSQRKGYSSTDGEKSIQDSLLRDLVSKGFGYHHGGLPPDDRAAVEESYLSGKINVLCSTSTLAHGVNLPAHLVIIKGTYCWRGGVKGYETLPKSEVIQMMGRAGRPGFDTQGVAVIMTSSEEKKNYEKMSLSADVVESQLPAILIEAICAEITQNVIGSLREAIEWLKSTFFYIRVKRNPNLYGFETARDADHLDFMLMEMCVKALGDLSAANVIKYDSETFAVEALTEAHIMSRNMIKFPSMVLMMKLPRDCDIPLLFKVLSGCEELLKPLRRNEKVILNGFMKSIRYPQKTKVQDSATKAYVLMLAAAERLPIQDFSLRVEQSEIVEVALRVLSALQSLCIEREIGCLLETAILVDRAIRVRMWEVDYGSVFFQCQGLSDLTKKGLNQRRAQTVDDLNTCSQFRVQDLLACSVDEAKQVLLFTSMCNLWTLDLRMGYGHIVDGVKSCIQIDVLRANTASHSGHQVVQRSGVGKSGVMDQQLMELSPPHFQLICYHAQTSVLLCHRRLDFNSPDGQNRSTGDALLSYTVPLPADIFLGDVKCVLLSSVVGLDAALLPRGMAASIAAPQSVVGKAKKQLKGTNRTSTNAAVEAKNDKAVAVGSRILIQKNTDRRDTSINSTDGDMRTWMVRAVDKRLSDDDNEIEEFPAKLIQRKGEGISCITKSSNAAKVGKVKRNKRANNFDETIPGTDLMMDFTRSGYDNKSSSDHEYFSRFNLQSFPPTLANCIVSSSHVESAEERRCDLVTPYQKQQQELEPKQLNRKIISDNAFIAYGSDDNDEEPSPQEYSCTNGMKPHMKTEDLRGSSAQEVILPQPSGTQQNVRSGANSVLSQIQPIQQAAAVHRSVDAMNMPKFYEKKGAKNSTEWVQSLDSRKNYYNGATEVMNGSRYRSILDDNSKRTESDYQDYQNSKHENRKFPSHGIKKSHYSQLSQSDLIAPSDLSGNTGRSSSGGGYSAELAMLRRKNIELQLDTIPVKRMRTVASPGFLRPESALNQQVQPKGASIVEDLKPTGKLAAKFDESWSGINEFDTEMQDVNNADYDVHGDYSHNLHQSNQSSGSQDIEILKGGQPFQSKMPTNDYDQYKNDGKLHSTAALPTDRHALGSFFDDEATGNKRADSKSYSDELYPWEIDRIRSDQYNRYGRKEYAKISKQVQVGNLLEEDSHYNFQSSQGYSPRGQLSTPQQSSVQKALLLPNRILPRHEVTPIQESNRQALTKLWNDSTLGGISKIIAEPVQKVTYPVSVSMVRDRTIDHLPSDRYGMGSLDTGSKDGGEKSNDFRADEPIIRHEGIAYGSDRGGNQTSNSFNYDNTRSSQKKIAVTPSNIRLLSSVVRKAEDDDLFDSGFF